MKKLIKLILISSVVAISVIGSDSLFLKKYFNDNVCDQVLSNQGYFKTCYDYKMKGAKFVAYTINANTVHEKNIKKRPRFYEDKKIPKKYRSKHSDYTRNVYKNDRGHLCEDAISDYSQKSLNAAYVMSNIIPQASTVNRGSKAWKGLEKFGRTLAVKLGKIDVLNGVVYASNPPRIGNNQIAVPQAYWKMYYNEKENYSRCFYFENKQITDKSKRIKDYEVECSVLTRRVM